jgi:alkaline phosphatase
MLQALMLSLALLWSPLREDPMPQDDRPRNIILVIGDGMGLAHIALAEYLHKPPSPIRQMEVIGLQKTHSATHLVTDSGAAGTAMSCGVKTFNSAIGLDADSTPVKTIMELARDNGIKTGFVVTSTVVHATPASFYAHVKSRGAYEQIASQLVESGIDVFVGGGERYFSNRYGDKADLIKALQANNYAVIQSEDTHNRYRLGKIDPAWRIACFTAMEDPQRASSGRTWFPYIVQHAIDALKKREKRGYLMMIEASQVDWASHANNTDWLVPELQDAFTMLDMLVKRVKQDGNTLLIVTADHECGNISLRGKRAPRVEFNGKVHSPYMVPVFATGPGAELFAGIYENTEIFEKIRYLMGI